MFSPVMTVTRIAGDPKVTFTQTVWDFRFIENGTPKIVLTKYVEYQRDTPRHKYKPIKNYDTYDKRNSNISLNDVPLPEEVMSEAKDQFIKQLENIMVVRTFSD